MKTSTKIINVYIAEDGTEFTDAKDCAAYDHSDVFDATLADNARHFGCDSQGHPGIYCSSDLIILAEMEPKLLRTALAVAAMCDTTMATE